MKSPKLFGQPGATMAKGKAKARALQDTGAPFLTARGPGYTARMKNGFLKVEVDEAEQPQEQPLFWMLSNVSPERAQTATAKRKVKALPIAATADLRVASAVAANIGANRMAYIAEDRYLAPGDTVDYHINTAWAVVGSPRNAGDLAEYPPADMLARSIFATGWDDARKTWRWGFASKVMGLYATWSGISSTSAPLAECAPRANIAGLDASTTTAVTPPNEGSRVYYGGAMYVVGPGKLASLVCVGDYIAPGGSDPTVLRVTPYVLTSDDHGETWTKATAAFTVPFIRGGFVWSSDALRLMGSWSFFAYMGSGKSLFTLRYLDPTTSDSVLKAKCYIYESGAFTAVSWGYDASAYAPAARMRLSVFGTSGIAPQLDTWCSDPESWCFGPGCLALNVFHGTDPFAPQGLRITRDYGATWSEVYTTALLGAGHYSARMLVARPYLSEEAPGLIYLVASSGAGMEVFKTDGRFLSTTLLGTVPGANWTGVTLINKGASPYPQLPDEFGPPT